VSLLLDTNVVIDLARGRSADVRARLRDALERGETIWVSAIVLYEFWYGAARSVRRREHEEWIRTFLSGDIEVAAFEGEDAMAAGALRAELEALGSPIGPYDLLIAAQALRLGATLVTANVGEFSRVSGLEWADWSEAPKP
jgi:tRNA(fMet)-specific endonuclease VapC